MLKYSLYREEFLCGLMETIFISNATFTPTEAAAFVHLPTKRIYKEVEYKVIHSVSDSPRLPFAALVYLRAFKEINFQFPVDYRINLYHRLLEAIEQQQTTNFEIAKFFTLQIEPIKNELLELIGKFNTWKKHLVKNPNIMGGEAVFPNSRLTVRHIGSMLERGELPSIILEDYPYLTQEDIQFSRLYVKAYPSIGRPKKHEVVD